MCSVYRLSKKQRRLKELRDIVFSDDRRKVDLFSSPARAAELERFITMSRLAHFTAQAGTCTGLYSCQPTFLPGDGLHGHGAVAEVLGLLTNALIRFRRERLRPKAEYRHDCDLCGSTYSISLRCTAPSSAARCSRADCICDIKLIKLVVEVQESRRRASARSRADDGRRTGPSSCGKQPLRMELLFRRQRHLTLKAKHGVRGRRRGLGSVPARRRSLDPPQARAQPLRKSADSLTPTLGSPGGRRETIRGGLFGVQCNPRWSQVQARLHDAYHA